MVATKTNFPTQSTLDRVLVFVFCCNTWSPDGRDAQAELTHRMVYQRHVGGFLVFVVILEKKNCHKILVLYFCFVGASGRAPQSLLLKTCPVNVQHFHSRSVDMIPSLGILILMAKTYYAIKSKAVSGLWQWDRLVGSGMGASIP
jgi:hypothetical protein